MPIQAKPRVDVDTASDDMATGNGAACVYWSEQMWGSKMSLFYLLYVQLHSVQSSCVWKSK